MSESAEPSPSTRRESALNRYALRKSPKDESKLPKRLSEISGLATTSDDRLLAHNDERGIIYEVSIDGGEIIKSFQLGPKVIKADFEGIAVAEKSIFLVTSEGKLYETIEGPDGAELEYATYNTGIGENCEVEGLEYEPDDRTLLLACKTTRGAHLKDGVVVFRWSIENKSLAVPDFISVSEDDLKKHLHQKKFHPSGIARHPSIGSYLIISAREHAIIEITATGEIVAAQKLKSGRHPHAEGMTLLERKTGRFDLIISNEGDDRRARIARYRDLSRNKDD